MFPQIQIEMESAQMPHMVPGMVDPRFADVNTNGAAGAAGVPATPYGQYGFPWASSAPIPPAMPTYLPPPPFVPQETPAAS